MTTPAQLGITAAAESTVTFESNVDIDALAVTGTPGSDVVPQGSEASKWGGGVIGTSGGVVTFNFAGTWSAADKVQMSADLALWSDIAHVTFVQVSDVQAASQVFYTGTDRQAVTYSQTIPGAIAHADIAAVLSSTAISIDTSVPGWTDVGSFSADNGYGIDTLVHEDGHMLGLNHTGDYNATGSNQTFHGRNAYDTRQWSIMSYIDPSDPSQPFYNQSSVTGTNWTLPNGHEGSPQTWMPLDILAIQRLYGAPTTTPLSGGQTFGFHCNVAGPSGVFFDFTRNTTPIVTLWDAGTNNTLDLSGFAQASIVDLIAGQFSDAGGLTNNIGIGYGVHIDGAVGGPGDNAYILNSDSDTITGGGGSDTVIMAYSGVNMTESGTAADRIWTGTVGGGTAADRLHAVGTLMFVGGGDILLATTRSDRLVVSGGRNAIFSTSANLDLTSSGSDTVVASAGSVTLHGAAAAGAAGDIVFGSPGVSILDFGGAATDTIVASAATLAAGTGGLVAFGNGAGSRLWLDNAAGQATVVGAAGGTVTVSGAEGGLFVAGSAGGSMIDIGRGAGVVFGVADGDTLSASAGSSGLLIGGGGSELLDARTATGDMVLYAGRGNDTLIGGSGVNILVAGSGAATAHSGTGLTVFDAQNGSAGGSLVIADWNPAVDYVGIFGYGTGGDAAALASATADGAGGTSIILPDQTRIDFVGLTTLDPHRFF